MKKYIMGGFFLFSSCALFASAAPVTSSQQPAFSGIHDEVDKTDVYAIPLDSSEQEEKEEENRLEKLQTYEQNKRKKDQVAPTNKNAPESKKSSPK